MASSRVSAAVTLLLGLMMLLLLGSSTSNPISSTKGPLSIKVLYKNILHNKLRDEVHKCTNGDENIRFSITIGNKTHTNTKRGFTNSIPVASHFNFGYNPVISSLYKLASRMPENEAANHTIDLLKKCTFDKTEPTITTAPSTKRKTEPTTKTAPGTKKHSVTRKHRHRAVKDEYSDTSYCKQLLGLAELWRIFVAYKEMPCV